MLLKRQGKCKAGMAAIDFTFLRLIEVHGRIRSEIGAEYVCKLVLLRL